MTFVAVSDCAEVVFNQELWGERIVNRIAVHRDGTWDAVEMTILAAALAVEWSATAKGQLGSGHRLTDITVTGLRAEGDDQVVYTIGFPIDSTVVSESMPGNVAFCCKLLTGHRGRSYRGRWYWGGIPTSVVTHNAIDDTPAGNLRTALAGLRAAANILGWEVVIISRVSEGAPRDPPIWTEVTSVAYTDTNLDSMRRRLAGRGA